MENINFIDLMFAVIIGVSILLGLIRGLFRAVFWYLVIGAGGFLRQAFCAESF